MKITNRTAEKGVGKSRRLVTEVTGDGRLDEEGCRQERQVDEDEKTNVATMANKFI